MAKYIDADHLQVEVARYYDKYKGKFKSTGDRYYLGLIDGLDIAERFIDSLRQEQPCETCTNDKGCVTCKDGELWEGKEQPSEDLEKEIENTIDNTFCDMNGIAYLGITGYATVEDMKYIARHFYELGLNARKEE